MSSWLCRLLLPSLEMLATLFAESVTKRQTEPSGSVCEWKAIASCPLARQCPLAPAPSPKTSDLI